MIKESLVSLQAARVQRQAEAKLAVAAASEQHRVPSKRMASSSRETGRAKRQELANSNAPHPTAVHPASEERPFLAHINAPMTQVQMSSGGACAPALPELF